MSGHPAMPYLGRDMSGASDEQLLKVVGLIDTLDRRGAVDRLLAPVRDRLALLRPARPITLGRVLVLPFEELVVPEDQAWPGRRCFSRAHLGSVIERLTEALPPALVERLRTRADGHSMIAGDVVRDIGSDLWPAAATVAAGQLAGGELEPALRDQLAGVTPLLALGPILVPAIWQLPPRPMGTLARTSVEQLIQVVRLAAPLGETAVQSVLELLLARSASPRVLLEPLRGADLALPSRARDAMLTQLVQRRIGDMRQTATRLAAGGLGDAGSRAGAVLQLAADLDALEGNWSVSPSDRSALGEIRGVASTLVGSGIDSAVQDDILGRLEALARPEGLSDEGVDQLEETARHTRRLGIAGARLGLAATPDALLARFLPTLQDALSRPRPNGAATSGLLDQVRVVEILLGPDTAFQLYQELRGATATASTQ